MAPGPHRPPWSWPGNSDERSGRQRAQNTENRTMVKKANSTLIHDPSRWAARPAGSSSRALAGLAAATLAVAVGSLFFGASGFLPQDVLGALGSQLGLSSAAPAAGIEYMVLHLRLPRILLALMSGGILALSGAAMQALFRNPLADPSLIGVTSGAMVFTVGGIVLLPGALAAAGAHGSLLALALFGFLGGLLSTGVVYRLSAVGGRAQVATMLLAGIAVSAVAGAVTGLFTYFSSEAQLRDITFWTLGSLSGAHWTSVAVMAALALPVAAVLIAQSRALNLFLLGEQEAAYAGVDVERVKRRVVIAAAMGVGACVAACGIIGFVGLVVPHLLRMARGTDHRWLMPAAGLLGGLLLVGADTVARTAIAPAELPIGVLTALLGGPFFLWLLLRSKAAGQR